MLRVLKRLDAYPKTLEDFKTRTLGGATISVVASVFICFLFFSELAFYMNTEIVPELSVDVTRGEKLQINVDVVFPHLPCAFVGLDAMDVSGEAQLEIDHTVYKKRLDEHGNPITAAIEVEQQLGKPKPPAAAEAAATTSTDKPPCGSCYGAEQTPEQCCNTCDEVREAYRRKGWGFANAEHVEQCQREGFVDKLNEQRNEGCHIYGSLFVNKVAGNFHFAPGRSFQNHHMHVHDLSPFKGGKFNLSHEINSLSFGKPFPGARNPLDGVKKATTVTGSAIYQYFVKIVPTEYHNLDGDVLKTNQYSVTEHFRQLDAPQQAGPGGHSHGGGGLPGVFVIYDNSPIMVTFKERRRSFTHFLTGVCAIVGGVFTVAGMIDSLVFHSVARFKRSIGKAE